MAGYPGARPARRTVTPVTPRRWLLVVVVLGNLAALALLGATAWHLGSTARLVHPDTLDDCFERAVGRPTFVEFSHVELEQRDRTTVVAHWSAPYGLPGAGQGATEGGLRCEVVTPDRPGARVEVPWAEVTFVTFEQVDPATPQRTSP